MTEITETICRPKQSWMTAPWISKEPEVKETLDGCIARVFDIPEVYLSVKGRYMIFTYAKHLRRYIFERLLKNGTLAENNFRRFEGREHRNCFKYCLKEVAELTGCDHATVVHSSRTCQNLMETDRIYREKCNQVIEKLNNNLLILPE